MIDLLVNGLAYRDWQTVEVTRSVEAMAGEFVLGVVNRYSDDNPLADIRDGDECVLKLDGEVVITGFVDKISASIGEVDEENVTPRRLTITGRDRSGQLVDCSPLTPPSQWEKQTALAIMQALTKPFGVTVTAMADIGNPFPQFALEPGEAVHDALMRLCRARGLLMIPDCRGNLIIPSPVRPVEPVALTEGLNLKVSGAERNSREVYSQITVKGQSAISSANATTKQRAAASYTAKDPNVRRFRPLVVMAKEQATVDDCKRQANWEMASRNGKSLVVTATVFGWRQRPGGKLWSINQLVRVVAPSEDVAENLVITELTQTYGMEGTECQITLMRPGALLPEPPELETIKKGKKGRKGKKKKGKGLSEADRRRLEPIREMPIRAAGFVSSVLDRSCISGYTSLSSCFAASPSIPSKHFPDRFLVPWEYE